MKEFEALKNLWDSQAIQPDVNPDDILKNLRKTKREFTNKLLFETIAVFVIIILLAIIWIKTPFMLWTSHLAMSIFMVCCLYYLSVQWSDYKRLQNSEFMLKKPEEYIEYLKIYRKGRYLLNTRKYAIYSIFIGLAFALYFIEIYFIATRWQTLIGGVFVILWFLLCGLLMRAYRRREEEKLNDMIKNLERLQQQFK